jgi:hypothetical protein
VALVGALSDLAGHDDGVVAVLADLGLLEPQRGVAQGAARVPVQPVRPGEDEPEGAGPGEVGGEQRVDGGGVACGLGGRPG